MRRGECPSFERCSAPLCPLDAESVARGVWYADEPVCVRQGQRERWLGVQKRIVRQTRGDAGRGYFTVAMLEAVAIVGRAIRGLDADNNHAAEAEAAWVARKRSRAPSEAARQKRREQAATLGKHAIRRGRGDSDCEKVSEAIPEGADALGHSASGLGGLRGKEA